ncbi:MAG: hypothetical protein JWN04_2203 [Myxococcaceae bacterium]|nr:hypothetical protein [Myxococcaceae bacterium]
MSSFHLPPSRRFAKVIVSLDETSGCFYIRCFVKNSEVPIASLGDALPIRSVEHVEALLRCIGSDMFMPNAVRFYLRAQQVGEADAMALLDAAVAAYRAD